MPKDDDREVPRSWKGWLDLMRDESLGSLHVLWSAVGHEVNAAGVTWRNLDWFANGWVRSKGKRQIQRDFDALEREGLIARYWRSMPSGGRITLYVLYPDLMDEQRLRTLLDPGLPYPQHPRKFREADFAALIDRFAPDEFRGDDRAMFRRDIGGRIATRHEMTRPDATSDVPGPSGGSSAKPPSRTSSRSSPRPSETTFAAAVKRSQGEKTVRAPSSQMRSVDDGVKRDSGSEKTRTSDTTSSVVSEDRNKSVNGVTNAEVEAELAARRQVGERTSPGNVRAILEMRAASKARAIADAA